MFCCPPPARSPASAGSRGTAKATSGLWFICFAQIILYLVAAAATRTTTTIITIMVTGLKPRKKIKLLVNLSYKHSGRK